MRLINADELKEWADIVPYTPDGGIDVNDFIKKLDSMPTAEAVEVIRCEYCAHRNQYRFPPKYEVRDYCEVHEKVTTLTNFCSWAERRQE